MRECISPTATIPLTVCAAIGVIYVLVDIVQWLDDRRVRNAPEE